MPFLFGRHWSKQELLRHVGNISQIAGVELMSTQRRAPRGVRLARFRTGSGLDFDVLLDRGMDIGKASYRGEALAWQSATGPVSPAFYGRGGGWLRGFHGGLVTTCGLTYLGSPCVDQGRASRPAHGGASNTPAEGVWVDAAWQDGEYVMWAQGRLREAAVFGENVRCIGAFDPSWGKPHHHRRYSRKPGRRAGATHAPLPRQHRLSHPRRGSARRDPVAPSDARDADAERELGSGMRPSKRRLRGTGRPSFTTMSKAKRASLQPAW